jgi:hypothetical protein
MGKRSAEGILMNVSGEFIVYAPCDGWWRS